MNLALVVDIQKYIYLNLLKGGENGLAVLLPMKYSVFIRPNVPLYMYMFVRFT
jgi:hypothetical protein